LTRDVDLVIELEPGILRRAFEALAKREAGRPQDLADVAALEGLERLRAESDD